MLSGELKALEKRLASILKRYDKVRDIIIFGSAVKEKAMPADIDLAVLMQDKHADAAREIRKELAEISQKVHTDLLNPEDMYLEKVGLSLLMEGYSIRQKMFIRDILGIQPKEIITYTIKDLPHKEKLKFGKAMRTAIKNTHGQKLGAGSVMIPIEQSGYMDDFMGIWGIKYKAVKIRTF